MADINTQLQGLLSNPMFNIGTGLLAASGPSRDPVGFGQALASGIQYGTQRQAEQMKLEQARNEMLESKRRQEVISQFSGLLTPGQTPGPVVSATPPAINTPEGQSQAMGLLGQIYPEAFAQQAAARQFPAPVQPEAPRVSTSVNDFMLMNPDLSPGSPEFRAGYKEFVGQQDPSGALTDQVQLQLLSLQLENERAKRAEEERTRTQESAGTRKAIYSDLAKLEEMGQLNERLGPTFLAPGMVNPDMRRDIESVRASVSQLFGGDTTESQKVISDFDRFSKLTQDFVIGSIDRLNGSGALTDTKFNALISSNASLGSSPQANNLIIADNINSILDGAAIEGIEVPNADRYRELAQRLKGVTQPARVDVLTAPLDQIDLNSLTPEQQRQLDQRLREAGF